MFTIRIHLARLFRLLHAAIASRLDFEPELSYTDWCSSSHPVKPQDILRERNLAKTHTDMWLVSDESFGEHEGLPAEARPYSNGKAPSFLEARSPEQIEDPVSGPVCPLPYW